MAGIEINMAATDPEELARIFESLEAGEDATPTTAPETPATPTEQAATTEKVEQATTQPQTAEQGQVGNESDAQGVATRDGKHVIPYSVLKSERDRATRAEALAAEMRERVAALEAIARPGNQEANQGASARTTQQPTANDLSQEDLEALKEDFPTVYKAVMASMAAAKALEAKFQPVEESVRNQETERAQTATESVQEAIDTVPKLAHIQASDPAAFALAQQFDATLRALPAWAEKSLSQRFAKVIEMVEGTMGAIDLPGQPQASQTTSAESLKNAALAKAQASAKATNTNVPTSLSEFPAGQHAAQDEREAAEQLSQLQLAEKFGRMTPDQMDAYFQSL